jgi:chitinase
MKKTLLLFQFILFLGSWHIGKSQTKDIIGYYANWKRYERNELVTPQNIDYNKYTTIIYAFFSTDVNGNITPSDPYGDSLNLAIADTSKNLISKAHNRGKKVLLAIGGASNSGSFTSLTTTTKQRNFAHGCISKIIKYGFDGIDIDWEFPSSATDSASFSGLIKSLRDSLNAYGTAHSKTMYLTAAVGTDFAQYRYINWPTVTPKLDWINLMAYDYITPSQAPTSSTTSMHSPLYKSASGQNSVDSTVKKYTTAWPAGNGVPASKINLGIPFYGYSWKPASSYPTTGSLQYDTTVVFKASEQGSHPYWSIDSLIGIGKLGTLTLDATTQSYYRISTTATKVFLSYEPTLAAAKKANYIINNNLRGAMVWELTQDYIETSSGSGIISKRPLIDTINTIFINAANAVDAALTFDGVNDKATVPSITSYNIGTGNFTIEAWIINSGAADKPIVSKRTSGSNGFLFTTANGGTKLSMIIAGSTITSNTFESIANSTTPHHVAARRNGSSLIFYLDGVSVGGVSISASPGAGGSITSTGSLLFGTDAVLSTAFFSGKIDKVRLWNLARTEIQLQNDLNNNTPSSTTGLIGAWNFNEGGSGQSLADISSNSNSGFLGGSLSVESSDPTRNNGTVSIGMNAGLTFDGSTTKVAIPDNSNYDITYGPFKAGDFTLEAWVKLSSTGPGLMPIITKRTSASEGLSFVVGFSGTKLLLTLTSGLAYQSSTFTNIFDNSCHHLAVTRSGTNLSFYLDGVAKGTVPCGTDSLVHTGSTSTMYVGYDPKANTYAKGNINEVRFWGANLSATYPSDQVHLANS